MRSLPQIVLTVAVLYGALLGVVFAAQRSLQYVPSVQRVPPAEAGLPDFAELTLETADGERLVAWWKPPEPGRAVVLYLHGNGGGLLHRSDRARLLTEDGRGLLLLSYRGYSGSTGLPTEAGLRADAQAAYEWLIRSYAPARIVLYGESLGSGVAVWLASERPIGGLILDAPFTSAADVAKLSYWFLPVDWLMHDQYRSIDLIGRVRAPVLVLHGDRDRVVPIALGERLFAVAPEPKRFVRLSGVDHVSALEAGGIDPVRGFLGTAEERLGS